MKQLVTMKNLLLTNARRKPNALSTEDHVTALTPCGLRPTDPSKFYADCFLLLSMGGKKRCH